MFKLNIEKLYLLLFVCYRFQSLIVIFCLTLLTPKKNEFEFCYFVLGT